MGGAKALILLELRQKHILPFIKGIEKIGGVKVAEMLINIALWSLCGSGISES